MSSDEVLDIVNEDDEVIGTASRREVHKKHQIHRGIHVFIFNNQEKLLIQKRSNKKNDRPGFFDASVGAQVLSGESYLEAALREAEEELGVENLKLRKICKYKSFSDRQREIRVLFTANSDGPFKIDKREVASVKFYDIDEIKKKIDEKIKFTTGFKISFRLYMKLEEKNLSNLS